MTQRQCGSCTKCCGGWIRATVNGVTLSLSKPCQFLTDVGCGIYETRPEVPCRSFTCGWLSDNSPLPEHMNPANCGAIIMFDRKWRGYDIVYATPTGPKIPQETLDWLMNYARTEKIPLQWVENKIENGVYIGKELKGYGPPIFVEAVGITLTNEDVFI